MYVLYTLIAAQMAAWAIFSAKGGKLSDKGFIFFSLGMMIGQLGAGIETFVLKAWGAFTVQMYFFAFTAYGGVKRLNHMKNNQ